MRNNYRSQFNKNSFVFNDVKAIKPRKVKDFIPSDQCLLILQYLVYKKSGICEKQ